MKLAQLLILPVAALVRRGSVLVRRGSVFVRCGSVFDRQVAAAFVGFVVLVALAPLLSSTAWSQIIAGDVPKQVDLVVDADRLVASNIRFSRFDELVLRGRERVRDMAVGEAVIVVVTTQRIIAYGVLSGWRSVDREPNEQIENVSAQDYGGLIVTSKRLLNFNGQSGVWGEQDRRPSQ